MAGCLLPVNLPITALRFRFETESPPQLPRFAGSAWRGAFGHALKKAVCVARGTPCPSCLLYRSCAYPYIFETPLPLDSAKMRRYPTVPHPYVFQIEDSPGGGDYILGLSLFGHAERYAAYVVHALQRAGQAGLGCTRQAFHLREVRQAAAPDFNGWTVVYRENAPLELKAGTMPAVPDCPTAIRIGIETPLRLRRLDHLVTPGEFGFADLFGSLLRRLSMLTYFHTDTPLETDFGRLTRLARDITLHAADLHWFDWTRYSSRQHTTMEMGGLIGEVTASGEALGELWPYLWMGQWTHAGKATTMGLGRYRIMAAPPSGDRAMVDQRRRAGPPSPE